MRASQIFVFVLLAAGLLQKSDGAYFTMAELELDIPGNRSLLLPNNTAVATMFALNDRPNPNVMDHVRYSLKKLGDEHYLEIYHIAGDILFTTAFLNETAKNTSSVEALVFANDSSGVNETTFRVNILSPDIVDCDLITPDLCFWKSVTYRIFENREPSFLGSLSSTYLSEMCAGYKINYTLINGSSHFALVPPTDLTRTWGLKTTQPLDRDVSRSDTASGTKPFGNGQTANVTISCKVVNPKGTERNLSRTLSVIVLDENDNPLTTRHKDVIKVTVDKATLNRLKNQSILSGVQNSQVLMFYDKDSKATNSYKPHLSGNGTDFLQPRCKDGVDDRHGEHQTVYKCELIVFKIPKLNNGTTATYSALLQVEDASLLPGNGNNIIEQELEITIVPKKTKEEPLPMTKIKPTILYPGIDFQILRTAAPFARITQPGISTNVSNFRIIKQSPNNRDRAIAVTKSHGIVYVNNSQNLYKKQGPINLVVEWDRNGTKQSDNLTILIKDPTSLSGKSSKCLNRSADPDDWDFCALHDNPSSCERECGLATGGSFNKLLDSIKKSPRCSWVTLNYTTCTSDVMYCPNFECDELEKLHPLICPQDCAERMAFPTIKNPRTNKGIAPHPTEGVGCTCSLQDCFCEPLKKRKMKNTSTTTLPPSGTSKPYMEPRTGKHPGPEINTCGTSCLLGIAAGILFLLGFVAMIVACWRHDRVQKAVRNKLLRETQDLSAPLSDYVDRGVLPDGMQLNFDMITALNYERKIGSDPKWEFPRSQLVIEQTLGEGEFGRVLRAKAKDIGGQIGYTTVAVKTLKEDARGGELADLLSEYELLKEVSHPNVIKLLGACTAPGGPVYLIIEFAQHGSLRSYLRRSRHLKSDTPRVSPIDEANPAFNYDHPNASVEKIIPQDILSFAWQISKGMAYLTEIKLVHRDLAARNILLGSGKICKISDFGLTRDVYEDNAYFKRSKGRVPVKWMAPESLSDHIYTSKSDVWSFGILVWELVTLGATPYPGVQVQNLFHLLKQGYRMERPENCSVMLYKLMRSCWNLDPSERPPFQCLAEKFEKMLSDGVEYLDLTTNAIHNRSYFCANIDENKENNENANNNTSIVPSVNYLEKLQQYVKCGESDKILNDDGDLEYANNLANLNNIPTQGYETPIKVPKDIDRPITPTNECPQYYTNMAKQQT